MVNQTKIKKSDAVDKLAELKGLEITHAWRGHGSAIFLEFGLLKDSPRGNNPIGEVEVMIEWSWRIEDLKSIILGSWSDNEEIDKFPELVVGKRIKDVQFTGRIPELELTLTDNLWLLTFMTEKGYPGWSIKFKNGAWLSYDDGSFVVESET